jgi:hypothetical protein
MLIDLEEDILRLEPVDTAAGREDAGSSVRMEAGLVATV